MITMVGIVCVIGRDTARTEVYLQTLRHRGANVTITNMPLAHSQGSATITIGICAPSNTTDFLWNQPQATIVDSLFETDVAQLATLIKDLANDEHNENQRNVITSQFGIAIIALEDSRLLCWRSLDGQKALYIGSSEHSTILATEKKALWLARSEDIRAIEPGEILAIGAEGTITRKMIKRPTTRFTGTEEQALKMLEASLQRAVDFLVGSRCGVLFSGGVDSSLLAHIVNKAVDDVTLFTASTKSSRDYDHGRDAAAILNMPLVEVSMTEDLFWDRLPKVMHAIETTNRMDLEIAFPFFMASEAAWKQGVELMVSGQGPDELFAGYVKHVYLYQEKGEAEVEAELWREAAITHEANISRDERAIAMAGLRTCFPYLYPRFAELALNLPARWKLDPGRHPERKVIFRSLATRLGLDPKLVYEPKKATQYSSGASRLLTKAIAKNVHECRQMSQREVEMVSQKILDEIGTILGIPVQDHVPTEFGINLGPTTSFLESRGF
jgi:asparagine synthetase B (glutamine-hydrolysing)